MRLFIAVMCLLLANHSYADGLPGRRSIAQG